MYEVKVLYIERGDHFYDSYSYEHIGYVDDNVVPYLRCVKVPHLNSWPGCHMQDWDLFQLKKIYVMEDMESLVHNEIERLLKRDDK